MPTEGKRQRTFPVARSKAVNTPCVENVQGILAFHARSLAIRGVLGIQSGEAADHVIGQGALPEFLVGFVKDHDRLVGGEHVDRREGNSAGGPITSPLQASGVSSRWIVAR